MRIVGGVIAAIGLVMLLTARIQLGRSFSVSAKAKKLVTTGVYSKIRNPIYVFSAMFLVGIVIVTGRWPLLLIIAVLVPVQIVRARKESQVLRRPSAKSTRGIRQERGFRVGPIY